LLGTSVHANNLFILSELLKMLVGRGDYVPVHIDEETLNYVRKVFGKIENEVKIYYFTSPNKECRFCSDIEEILRIVSRLHSKIKVIKRDEDSEEAKKYGIQDFPCILLHGKEEYNVRFFGIPAGYEFGTFIEDIVDVSHGRVDIDSSLRRILIENVKKPTRILVFVTPECPYCPIAVRSAHKYAIINKYIYGDMVEALEFPKLAEKYNVYSVPKNVIQVNGKDVLEFEGATSDAIFISKILEANGIEIPEEMYNNLKRDFSELRRSMIHGRNNI